MTTPVAFCQGPRPIRSRAFDGGLVGAGARTEIREPRPVASADRLGQYLAMAVRTR
jgi:hypothetical protein